MQLVVNTVNLTYPTVLDSDAKPSTDPTGAEVTFTVSELFGDIAYKSQVFKLNILYSDYLANFDDTALAVFVKQSLVALINANTLVMRVDRIANSHDGNGAVDGKLVSFTVINKGNVSDQLGIQAEIKLDTATYDTAKATKVSGIMAVVKSRLAAEFTAS